MRLLPSLLLAAALAAPLPGVALAEPGQITVTGEGRVDARPDLATISLGVVTQGETAAAAMAANSAELARVLERLRSAGIAARDLQTTGLALNPNWQNYDSGTVPVISGYTAQNYLTVRVRALETLGQVLDTAVKDGANSLNGVTFGLEDPNPALDQARKLAVADARARAELLTLAAGVKLGNVVSIAEVGGMGNPMPMFKAEASVAGDVPVAEGEVTTSASVTVVFAIEQ